MKREYPPRPIVGIGAIIARKGMVLLARRGSEPERNKWSVPGGLVELGERVEETVVREVKEETNLDVEVHSLVDVVDNPIRDADGRLRYHFVILDFFAKEKGGMLRAGSDLLEVKWVPFDQVPNFDLTNTFREFLKRNWEKLHAFSQDES